MIEIVTDEDRHRRWLRELDERVTRDRDAAAVVDVLLAADAAAFEKEQATG